MIHKLKEQIKRIQAEIEAIQEECSHPLACRITKNKSNTGNYDPESDSYWTEHTCQLCEKRWITDQDWKSIGDKRGMPRAKK